MYTYMDNLYIYIYIYIYILYILLYFEKMYIAELNDEPHLNLIGKFEFESNLIVVKPEPCDIVLDLGKNRENNNTFKFCSLDQHI
jgi:hypothetical protein